MAQTKNNDIQCLRAIAILLVLLQHYRSRLPTPDAYYRVFEYFGFWSGVDVFFAISGLLICQTFLRDLERAPTRRDAVTSFWRRRIARLFPAVAFWAALSVGAAALATSYPGAEPVKVAVSAGMALVGLSNLYWVNCVHAGSAACGSADFNGVTWSLSLEWQLYAALTTLILFIGKRGAVTLMLCAGIAMSFVHAPSFSFPWAFRVQAFSLGALVYLALAPRSGSLPRLPMPRWVALSGLTVGVLICTLAPVDVPQPFVLPAIAFGAQVCLIASLRGDAFSSSAAAKPLVWIGERSYSIYLCHLPIMLVTREAMHRTVGLEPTAANVATAVIAAGCLIAVAADLSYRWIELPFQEIAQKRTSTHVAADREPSTLSG